MANNVAELTEEYFPRIQGKLKSINNPDWMVAITKVTADIEFLRKKLAEEPEVNHDYVKNTCVALESVVDKMVMPSPDYFEIEKEVHILRDVARNSKFSDETKRKIYMTGIGLACAAIVGGIVLGLLATNPIGASIAGTLFIAACVGLYYRESITKQLGWDRKPGTPFSFFNIKELSAESIYSSLSNLVGLLKTTPTIQPIPEETEAQQLPQHQDETSNLLSK